MLKKAGIVVAAAAAGLLAVSPLAFAGDKGDYDHGHGHGHHSAQVNNAEKNSSGLVNVSGNDINVPIQACNDNVNVLGIQVSDVTAQLTGVLGLLGTANGGDQAVDRSCTQAASAGDTANQSN